MSEQAGMDELFGMMKIAKTQQEAVQAALEGLAAERAAMVAEIGQQARAVKDAAGAIRQAADDATPAIQKAAGEAVGASVRQTLAGSLSNALRAVNEAEASIKSAGQWFAWKWVAVAAGGLAGVCLVAYGSLAWQRHQVGKLYQERAALVAEVASLRENVAELEKRGGKVVFGDCAGRLCFEVSTNQGEGMKDFRGPWRNDQTGTTLVIPRRY